jgi:RIO-like serine/threonine protein kinase
MVVKYTTLEYTGSMVVKYTTMKYTGSMVVKYTTMEYTGCAVWRSSDIMEVLSLNLGVGKDLFGGLDGSLIGI